MKKNRNAIIFIETRRLNGLKEKVQEFCDRVKWPCVVVCSKRNNDLFKSFDTILTENIRFLYEYNQLLTSFEFWKQLNFHQVLIAQHDSGVLRSGIGEFLKWDYVGAPWMFQDWGGNGGFSLRKVSVMKEISYYAKWNQSLGNEDLFFSNIMYYSHNYKLAPREVCEMFSVESEFKLGTFGYHFGEDSNRYLTAKQKETILNQYGRSSKNV
jgi:hypothetical protein